MSATSNDGSPDDKPRFTDEEIQEATQRAGLGGLSSESEQAGTHRTLRMILDEAENEAGSTPEDPDSGA